MQRKPIGVLFFVCLILFSSCTSEGTKVYKFENVTRENLHKVKDSFGTEGGAVTLDPSKGLYMSAGPSIEDIDKFTKNEEKMFFEEYMKLELFLVVNHEEYYVYLDGNDAVESIYED